jgi:hypothetical protein
MDFASFRNYFYTIIDYKFFTYFFYQEMDG